MSIVKMAVANPGREPAAVSIMVPMALFSSCSYRVLPLAYPIACSTIELFNPRP